MCLFIFKEALSSAARPPCKYSNKSAESKNDSLCIDSDLMYLIRFGLVPDPFNYYNASL